MRRRLHWQIVQVYYLSLSFLSYESVATMTFPPVDFSSFFAASYWKAMPRAISLSGTNTSHFCLLQPPYSRVISRLIRSISAISHSIGRSLTGRLSDFYSQSDNYQGVSVWLYLTYSWPDVMPTSAMPLTCQVVLNCSMYNVDLMPLFVVINDVA